jgi:hypothetical protein
LQELASVAYSTGVVDRSVWLGIASPYLGCTMVLGCGFMSWHYDCNSDTKRKTEKCVHDGAVVP